MAVRSNTKKQNFTQEAVQFDPVGNISRMRTQNDESVYSYDKLYQLTSESGLFAHEYANDSLYNRLQKDQEHIQVNDLNEDVSHFEYNKNGNPVRQGNTRYTYDALDRLIRIESPQQHQDLTYDSLHRCLSKTTVHNGVQETRYFLYDGQNEIGSFDERLNIQELRILGAAPHAEIGAAIAVEVQGKAYAPIHDLPGNIAALAPLDHGPASIYRYSAFGEEKIDGSILCPWHFSSKRSDASTGLIYYGRRYYMPAYGRWLTPDPAGFTDGMNLYAFVHNDPLTHYDEYGLIMTGYDWKSFQSMNSYNSYPVGQYVSKFGISLASKLTHEIYDYSGLGLIRNDRLLSGWKLDNNYQDHLSIDRFFGSQITMLNEFRNSCGIQFSEGILPCPGSLISSANRVSGVSRQILDDLNYVKINNRFHQAAKSLSETGQNNIRILRGWAKSKGWEKLPNSQGRPEQWGIYKGEEFKWRLKIKPEPSFRPKLDEKSGIPRFDVRLGPGGNQFINPFTGENGDLNIGKHLLLENEWLK